MLQLTINYESKWGNSFLDGDNNSPQNKDGRNYLASLKNLNDRNVGEASFIRRVITGDTVMGVLNRLIGDQRKLYQSRASEGYYFKSIEEEGRVVFEDRISAKSDEMVYLRNFSKSTDQNAYSGMINAEHPAFISRFSPYLWGVLYLPLDELCNVILHDSLVPPIERICPIDIATQYETVVGKTKNIKPESSELAFLDDILAAEQALKARFDVSYRNKTESEIQVYSLYCSALYLQVERLSKVHDVSQALTSKGGLPGFSKRGFTYKDFMKAFTTGSGKIVFGNPYYRETMVKGIGKTREMLTKTSGSVLITLDVADEQANEIMTLISNAGVMSFTLGKKGLAYLDKIKVI